MTLTATELVELHTLEAIELLDDASTSGALEHELQTTLSAVGIAEHQVDAVLVARTLRELERGGLVARAWRLEDVLPGDRVRPGAERVWLLTPGGEARLQELLERHAGAATS